VEAFYATLTVRQQQMFDVLTAPGNRPSPGSQPWQRGPGPRRAIQPL